MKVKAQPEVRKDMDVIDYDKTIQHTYSQMKVKEHLEVRKDIDVNQHDRLSITPIHK